jgi:hypothetical protein
MGHPTFCRTARIDGLSIFYREAGPGHLRIRVQDCGACHSDVVTKFARACLDNLHRRGGASRRTQQDVDLMQRAIVSQRNICAIEEYLPV